MRDDGLIHSIILRKCSGNGPGMAHYLLVTSFSCFFPIFCELSTILGISFLSLLFLFTICFPEWKKNRGKDPKPQKKLDISE